MRSPHSPRQPVIPIERFVWDLTYACPLRCIHCYSESGRRPARMLNREDMLRVIDAIIGANPQRVSFSGGEPLLVPWWQEAAYRLREADIPVALYTSGWSVDEGTAKALSASMTRVAVSIDGPKEEVHDAIRGRKGSFSRAMRSLQLLDQVKRECVAQGRSCYTLGIEYTVTRSGYSQTGHFIEEITSRFPQIDSVTFGAVIPEGLAQEEIFVEKELLSDEQLVTLEESVKQLASCARNGAYVSVTDARYFLPSSPLHAASQGIAHIEPDGQFRAFTNYEAKVGNILEEPLQVLWSRALAWRNDTFVAGQMNSIRSLRDWARVTRVLDQRYGSQSDRVRIARRNTSEITKVASLTQKEIQYEC